MYDTENFLGNEKLTKLIFEKLRDGSLSHAYMFVGPDGSGKKTLAFLIAKAVCCDAENSPCGVCNACKKVDDGVHPDVHFIAKEPGDATIKVDAIRKFISGINLTPNEASKKIYIIDNAETLGKEAQNVLLKTLEEPTGNALFMLLATSEAAILPTVRSRCTAFTMEPVSAELLKKHLMKKYGIDGEAAEKAVKISGGYVGAAYDAVEKKGGKFEFRDTAFSVLAEMAKGNKAKALALLSQKSVCTRDKLTQIYLCMQLAMRDIAAKSYGESHFEFFDSAEEAMQIKRKFTLSKALALYDFLENEKGELARNGNPSLSALRIISDTKLKNI